MIENDIRITAPKIAILTFVIFFASHVRTTSLINILPTEHESLSWQLIGILVKVTNTHMYIFTSRL